MVGPVAGAVFAAEESSQPTFLNIGVDYPNPARFTVLVWGRDRQNFDTPPEVAYQSQTVCVTGVVEFYDGRPEMIIDSPSDIVLANDAASTTTEPPPPSSTSTTQVPVAPASSSLSTGVAWDPVTFTCSPRLTPVVDREWQTSSTPERGFDGGPTYPADRMVLGLRNKWGWEEGQAFDAPVQATVTNPQGTQDVLSTYISGAQLAQVNYPADTYDMWSGIYTVVWSTDDGGFLACGGFEVAQLEGE